MVVVVVAAKSYRGGGSFLLAPSLLPQLERKCSLAQCLSPGVKPLRDLCLVACFSHTIGSEALVYNQIVLLRGRICINTVRVHGRDSSRLKEVRL